MKTLLTTLAISAFLSSAAFAADAEFHPSTYTTYKKHGPYNGAVRVLDRLPPAGQYTEIGLVRVGTDNVNNFSDAEQSLKSAAAQHGGTAIILEDDARLFSQGGLTPRGTTPQNATATAVIVNQ